MSALVGLSVMGVTAPSIMQMSIAPFEAQKRAQNLGVAETSAVVFAATYEGGLEIPENNDVCTSERRENTNNAYSVTCTHGSGKYVQSVTRAFRLAVPDEGLDGDDGSDTVREFANATPNRYSGHSCPIYDRWGTNGYNDTNYKAHIGACIPLDVWTQTAYQLSHPDAWLYDVNNYNGWGHHPDYDT